MIRVQELADPKGYYAVVMLCPKGELIAVLAGPFKGDKEANSVAKAERERIVKMRRRKRTT